MLVARWETKGKDYLELIRHEGRYSYRGRTQGGTLPTLGSDQEAIAYMERPWGRGGAGPVAVLQSDRPSLKRVI